MARPSELSEQISVVRALRRGRVLFAAVPNGGKRDRGEACRLKSSGVVAGVPDLLIFDAPPSFPDCAGTALEMKRQGGVPSDVSKAQKGWLEALEARGWKTVVAFGAHNALVELRRLGYPV